MATECAFPSAAVIHKSSSEHEEEDMWYVANEEIQPHKSTTASTTPSATLQTLLSPNITTPSVPIVKPKSDIQGQTLSSTTSQQHQQSKPSVDMKSQVLPEQPRDSVSVPGQLTKSSVDSSSTQKVQQPSSIGV